MLLRLIVAVVAAYVMFRVGMWAIRTFMQAPPPPPPSGEMRRVKMNYRCPTCGTEVRVTRAASEDPEPPRHCMDEMEYVPGEDD
ncbi:MAG TPA: hypothetical protein VHD87_18165 [Acidimicrobiales bacterium]|nr:hypothetical protein [Acidimicrobiales bacterium]